MKPGHNLGRHFKAGHGSAYKEDMLIPLFVAGKGVRHCEIDHARLVDLVPTLPEAIGEDPAIGPPMDGRSFWKRIRLEE